MNFKQKSPLSELSAMTSVSSAIKALMMSTIVLTFVASCAKDNSLSDEMLSKNRWQQSTTLKQNDLDSIYVFKCRKTSPDKSEHLYFSLYGNSENLDLTQISSRSGRVLYRSELEPAQSSTTTQVEVESATRSQNEAFRKARKVINPIILQISKFKYSKIGSHTTTINQDLYSLPVDIITHEPEDDLIEFKALANKHTLAYIKGHDITELSSIKEGDELATVVKINGESKDATIKNLSKLAEVLDSMPLSKVECL